MDEVEGSERVARITDDGSAQIAQPGGEPFDLAQAVTPSEWTSILRRGAAASPAVGSHQFYPQLSPDQIVLVALLGVSLQRPHDALEHVDARESVRSVGGRSGTVKMARVGQATALQRIVSAEWPFNTSGLLRQGHLCPSVRRDNSPINGFGTAHCPPTRPIATSSYRMPPTTYSMTWPGVDHVLQGTSPDDLDC